MFPMMITMQQMQVHKPIRAQNTVNRCCLCCACNRYGDEFDYDSEAVSVASGGIVRREALSWAAGDGRLTGDVRLAINDPLTGGCQVPGG
jgi:hypothetical protein